MNPPNLAASFEILINDLSGDVEPPSDLSQIGIWFRDFANRIQSDDRLRQTMGDSVKLWTDISSCFGALTQSANDSDALDILRFVSFARNLMGSLVSQASSSKITIIPNVVAFMVSLSHLPSEYPHRSDIFNACCALLVNFSAHNEDNILILRNCFFNESSSEDSLYSFASSEGPFVLILLDLLCPLDILGSTQQVLSKHAFRMLLSKELSFLRDHLRHKVIDIPRDYQEKLEFATSMILNTINQGATEDFYYALAQDDSSTSLSKVASPAQCLFLRILCEHFHRLDEKGLDCAFVLLSDIFFPICGSASHCVRLEWGGTAQQEQQNTSQAFRVWVSTVYVLETLTALASQNKYYRSQLLTKTSPDGHFSFLEGLIQLLGELHKYIKPSSLRDDPATGDNNVETESKHFAYAKVNAIALLGCIVEAGGSRSKEIQDRIRQLHGLELVLSSTVLDTFNPYIREYAIVCIRLLLENNPENQSFVADLQAQRVIPNGALEEAGYRPEIKNGSVELTKIKRDGG